MTLRRPFVQIAGISAELPVGDVLPNDIAWGIQAGRVYENFTLFNTSTSSNTANVFYVPVWIKQSFSTVVLSFNITALASDAAAQANIGLYDSLTGYPNVLLASQTGMNVSTTGGATGANATSPIVLSKTYPPGIYWLAYSHNSPTTRPTLTTVNNSNPPALKEITGATDAADNAARTGFSSTAPGGTTAAPLPTPIVPANMLIVQSSFVLAVKPS